MHGAGESHGAGQGMDLSKLSKAQRARELARWLRAHFYQCAQNDAQRLMGATALALEWEAFRLEREGGRRRIRRRPRLIVDRAA